MMGVERFRITYIFMLFCLAFGVVHPLHGQSITLQWNPNPEADLDGYFLHYGTQSRMYSQTLNVGDTTEYTVDNLIAGTMYFFAISAYDTAGNSSLLSEEIFGFVGEAQASLVLVNPYNYELSRVNEGDPYYLDRDYLVADIPAGYERLLWLKTMNDHKSYGGLEIELFICEKTRIYVAHDCRASAPE